MKTKLAYYIFIALSFVILEFGLSITTVSADGNDIILGGLRVDQSVVANARDYQTYLLASALPTQPDGATANWLSIKGSSDPTFTQVGLLAGSDGLHWFVETFYTPLGLTCLRGSGGWGYANNGNYMGCEGDANDLVTLDNWDRVELVTYNQGYWIARVYQYDAAGHEIAHADVADIYINTVTTIYGASVSVEESWVYPYDPHMEGSFTQKRPQYMSGGSFVDWPQSPLPKSGATYSNITADSSFCPSYFSASVNLEGTEREWYGGNSGDGICDWVLFPPVSTTGQYDDFSTNLIEYRPPSSNWTQISPATYALWNTITKSSSNSNDEARFTFNGSSITYFYTTGADRGHQTILLDGSSLDYLYSRTSYGWRRQIAKTWSVSSGDHTIQVINNDAGYYTDIDGFEVNIATVGAGTYDDNDTTDLKYTGIWTAASVPPAYNGTEHWSQNQGSLMRFTFTGSSITYCYSTANNRGKAGITIDGVTKPDLDLYSPTVQRRVCTLPYNLGSGIHNINIMVTGQKNSSSSGIFISIDYLVVQQ